MVSDQFFFHEKTMAPELLANLQLEEGDGDCFEDIRHSKEIKRRLLNRVREIADKTLTKKQKEAFYLKLMGKNSIQIGKHLKIAQMSAWERLDRAYRRIQTYLLKDNEIKLLLLELNP